MSKTRDKLMTVWLSPAEVEMVQAIAKARGMNVSQAVRELIREEAEREERKAKKEAKS